MPRDGSGNYTLPSGNPVVTNTVISSSGWANPTLTDLAAAITQSLSRDGQTTPTANLTMGNFRLTSLGAASARTDATNAGQIQDGGLTTLASVSGTDTITASTSPAITVYTAGQAFDFIAAGANTTGAVTLNLNGLGAKNVTKFGASPINPGDIQNGQSVRVRYDGTQFQMISPALGAVSGRNRIINGNCNIAQRGSLVLSTGVSGYGGPDRFNCTNGNSAGGQFTQSLGSITYNGVTKNAVVQTVNTAVASLTGTNFWYGIGQSIEGTNCYDLLGQPVAISFIFNTNVTGTYSVVLRDGNLSNSYVATFSATANTPVKVKIPVAVLPTYLSIPNTNAAGLIVTVGSLNQGSYQTSSLNAWGAGNFLMASGSVNWGANTNNFIAVTELQLEAGSVSMPYEEIDFGRQLQQCYRYYNAWQGSTPPMRGVTITASATASRMGCAFPVAMRAIPTLALSGSIQVYSGASSINVSAINTNESTATTMEAELGMASAFTAVGLAAVMFQQATGTITASAEL